MTFTPLVFLPVESRQPTPVARENNWNWFHTLPGEWLSVKGESRKTESFVSIFLLRSRGRGTLDRPDHFHPSACQFLRVTRGSNVKGEPFVVRLGSTFDRRMGIRETGNLGSSRITITHRF